MTSLRLQTSPTHFSETGPLSTNSPLEVCVYKCTQETVEIIASFQAIGLFWGGLISCKAVCVSEQACDGLAQDEETHRASLVWSVE